MAKYLSHTLHELPAGVLYGMDGATASECDELQSGLEDFRGLATAEGCVEMYAELLADCGLHFKAYKSYLLERHLYKGYSDFLEQRGLGVSR
jgi:hypothetical protein